MLKYKLTSQEGTTFADTQWGEGVCHETSGTGDLCSFGWLHYYHSPELAIILNPIHACINDPILWECEAEGEHKDNLGLKGGCTKLTTVRRIPLPQFSLTQMGAIGIGLSQSVFGGLYKEWNIWTERWLAGERAFDVEWRKSRYLMNYLRSSKECVAATPLYWGVCIGQWIVNNYNKDAHISQKEALVALNYGAAISGHYAAQAHIHAYVTNLDFASIIETARQRNYPCSSTS